MQPESYCASLTSYQRLQSREVTVGNVTIGGNNPIVVQSMTTTDTMDTEATVAQSIRMIESGCQLVRITAPSKKEAENLLNIKNSLREKGYDTPLVADIHFTPNAAEIAAKIVEKVRVNPGNYADKKKFEEIEYTDDSYQSELDRIEKRFTPLVRICKDHGTAMRIGTNHGSLSDRIMSRYGDTPQGMVESAMEFLRICTKEDFHNIVLSMKASNTQVMVQAYRLLIVAMQKEGMNYPLHLGVTEAGDGEDGRIKSAVGIGTLLEDGIGDTIRVSLTEEPEVESPVGFKLANRYESRSLHQPITRIENYPINPFEYKRRPSKQILNIGGGHAPVVVGDLSNTDDISPKHLFPFGYNYSIPMDKWTISDLAVDYLYISGRQINFEIPGTLGILQDATAYEPKPQHYPLFDSLDSFESANIRHDSVNFVRMSDNEILTKTELPAGVIPVIYTENLHAMPAMRRAMAGVIQQELDCPVIFQQSYRDLDSETFQLYSATDFGGLLLDGLGDGIWITATNCGGHKHITNTAFGILQATRTRISKTEYISCPSCGRTLFDLQETTAKIRKATHHLKGVKIGIMGCIVNGPGEMADADYGYVGTGPGKISLYKEKEVVQRNVPEADAVDALIGLIREHGDWVEPKEAMA